MTDVERYRANLQGEVDGAATYRAVADLEAQPERAEIFRRLAAVEEIHADFWRKKLTEAGAAAGTPRLSLRARLIRLARCRSLPAIPCRPDGRPAPARTETAAIAAPAVKPGTAEIVPVAHVPVHWRIIRRLAGQSSRTIHRDMRVRRLMIARQEAIAMPAMAGLLVSGRGERGGRQQRQENCSR